MPRHAIDRQHTFDTIIFACLFILFLRFYAVSCFIFRLLHVINTVRMSYYIAAAVSWPPPRHAFTTTYTMSHVIADLMPFACFKMLRHAAA